jgi:hypothetical protein
MEDNNQKTINFLNNFVESRNPEYNQTEFDFLFNNRPNNLIEEPTFRINMNFDFCIEEPKPVESNQTQKDSSTKQVKQKKFPKRFFYEHDYEIFYSNRKNRLMVKNYKLGKYVNMKLSSFILRYHDGLKQDNTLETRTCKSLIEYLEFQLKNGNLLFDFFINEDNHRLWLVIKTPWTEYLYDITTHFLVLCCNEEYEWFSLLDWNYTDYIIDYEVALNKTQYELLISWIHDCLKFMFIISHGTTN